MAGYGKQREPIDLIIAKGKKHLTKEEIAERKNSEINIDDYKNVKAPSYLSKKQKNEFTEIATKLVDIGIMSELDEDCLARYLIAKDNYLKFTKLLNSAIKNKASKKYKEDAEMQRILSLDIEAYLIQQDRAFKQCNTCADKLGLTISSRCRLQVPQAPEKPKENKFAKFNVI
ncbi:MAG: phage terminase small subunit P27 family [Clostridia bacterium]|nr:phage terminase small subunit P27 family [Clostridia bacterium]